MHRNVSILFICIVILGVLNISLYRDMSRAEGQAQAIELVPSTASVTDTTITDTIDESILLASDEKGGDEAYKITDLASTTRQEVKKQVVIGPQISAEEYLVGNLETGEIYLSLNPEKVFPIASLSKLYTALVVKHLFDPEQKIVITSEMLEAYGDAGNLKVDEKFTPDELLHALLMESSNDAAEAFAHTYGYTEFISEMNAFAKEIGMNKTSFKDSSGLSAYNISNAQDLFVLAQYLYKSEKRILEISSTQSTTIKENADHVAHPLTNINPFSANPNFIGGKTGRTDQAKESMVSLFNKTVDGTTYPIAIIVLRSDFGERETNTERLINMFVDKIIAEN